VGRELRRWLPRDEVTTRTVRLQRVGDRWRVASVVQEEVMPQAD
jgi:hypothetical protein